MTQSRATNIVALCYERSRLVAAESLAAELDTDLRAAGASSITLDGCAAAWDIAGCRLSVRTLPGIDSPFGDAFSAVILAVEPLDDDAEASDAFGHRLDMLDGISRIWTQAAAPEATVRFEHQGPIEDPALLSMQITLHLERVVGITRPGTAIMPRPVRASMEPGRERVRLTGVQARRKRLASLAADQREARRPRPAPSRGDQLCLSLVRNAIDEVRRADEDRPTVAARASVSILGTAATVMAAPVGGAILAYAALGRGNLATACRGLGLAGFAMAITNPAAASTLQALF